MSTNTGRAGSGRREAPRRTAGMPPAALARQARPARPGRKAVAGLAGFGSAAALAGAGIAMLASPGSMPAASGAHATQPGVQEATLTAAKIPPSTAKTPPQPTLPGSDGTDAANVNPPADPPGNLINPAAEPTNPTFGVQFNGNFPFSDDPVGGVQFGTPNGSAKVKMDLPSMLFGDPAGGTGTFNMTSSQASGYVNSLFGFLPTPPQTDLGSVVQNSRGDNGDLPSWVTGPLASQFTASANQDAADAFNALFGPGGSADNAQNITESLLPQPVPTVDPFAPVNEDGSLNTVNTAGDGSGADFAARFLASSPDPFSDVNVNIPSNPALGGSPAPAGTGTPADTSTASPDGGTGGLGVVTTTPVTSPADAPPDLLSTVPTQPVTLPAPGDSGTPGDTGTASPDGGTGGLGVVTTTPVTSPADAPPDLLSTVPTQPVTLPAPADAGSSDLSNFGAPPSDTLVPAPTSFYSSFGSGS